MDLRIIAGSLGGRRLRFDKAASGFRPTSERVREAVAGSIQTAVPGAAVADLCAGSGAFGFEMLSRGAASVDFVENNRARLRGLERHIAALKVEDRCRVIARDVRQFAASSSRRYNIIFYDPPYGDASLVRLAPAVAGLLCEDGVMAYEYSERDGAAEVLEALGGFGVLTRYYGDTAVSFIGR